VLKSLKHEHASLASNQFLDLSVFIRVHLWRILFSSASSVSLRWLMHY